MSKVIYLSEKKTMAHAKMAWLIADIIGIPTAIYAFILNLDNVKSAIIAILMIIYLGLRLYFYFVQKNQAVREKDIEIRSKEIDLWQKQQEKLKTEALTAKFRK